MNWDFTVENFMKIYDFENRKNNNPDMEYFRDETKDILQVYKEINSTKYWRNKENTFSELINHEILSNLEKELKKIIKTNPKLFKKVENGLDEFKNSGKKGKECEKQIRIVKAWVREIKSELVKLKLQKFIEDDLKNNFLLEKTKVKDKFVYKVPQENNLFFFPQRAIQQSIKYFYDIKPSNRNNIVTQLIHTLNSNYPFSVIKTDISSFYESISYDSLIDKIELDGFLPVGHIKFLKTLNYNYKQEAKSLTGIPRGIGISAYLAELAMKGFDKEVKENKLVVFYARFVDDIVVIVKENDKHCNRNAIKVYCEMVKLLPNSEDHKDLIFNEKKTKFCSPLEVKIDYLGYQIKKDGIQECSINIAKNKLKKIINRLELTRQAYFLDRKSFGNSKATKLFFSRLKFLTSVSRLSGKKSNVLLGIPATYPLLNRTDSIEKLNYALLELKKKMPSYIEDNQDIKFRLIDREDWKVYKYKANQVKEIIRPWVVNEK